MVKVNYTLPQKTYTILSYGGNFPKHNYTLCIDAIKVILLMQHLREKIQMKAGRLRTITIASQNYKVLPGYERGGKSL